jgi:hypothetical protein
MLCEVCDFAFFMFFRVSDPEEHRRYEVRDFV